MLNIHTGTYCTAYTHTTMRYRCEISNHGINGYEVWLHGRNQRRSGVKIIITLKVFNILTSLHGISISGMLFT